MSDTLPTKLIDNGKHFGQLFIASPIATLNLVVLIAGGTWLWSGFVGRIDNVERSLKAQGKEQAGVSAENKRRIMKLETETLIDTKELRREVSDTKVILRGVETQVQFLVNQTRRRPNE